MDALLACLAILYFTKRYNAILLFLFQAIILKGLFHEMNLDLIV
jgi:hypothetical protein